MYKGLKKNILVFNARLTCPASRNPGFAIVSSAVLVKVSNIVAAAPPWRVPDLLQSWGVT